MSDSAGVPLTTARRIARQARRYGYYQRAVAVSVRCPLCRSEVSEDSGHWGGSVVQRLDRAMLSHLEDCAEAVRVYGERGQVKI